MTSTEIQNTTTAICSELKELFGSPVLSTEKSEAYDAILAGFISSHKPWDFMSKMFVKWMADAAWDIFRYGHHKKLGIERKYRQRLEFQAKRAKAALTKKKQRADEQEDTEGLSPELIRTLELFDVIEGVPQDIDEIFDRSADERDHATALEDGIGYHEQLDGQQNSAIRRFNYAFAQLQQYREVTAWQGGQPDKVVDVEFEEATPISQDEAPIVPAIEGTADDLQKQTFGCSGKRP